MPGRGVGRVVVPSQRGRGLRLVGASIALAASASLIASTLPGGAATIRTDRQKIAALEQKINADGQRAETLVGKYNAVQAQLSTLRHQIHNDSAQLATDRASVLTATKHVREWAIDAYVSAQSGDTTAASLLGSSANSSRISEVQTYLGVTSGTLDDAVATLQQAENHTTAAQRLLDQQEAATVTTLDQLASAKQAADQAVASDEALLGSINENLLALITAQRVRAEKAKEAQEEQELAMTTAQPETSTPAPTPTPTTHVSPGNYANPLRAVRGLSPERIDQGVDFGGFGPIYALGDGVVISTYCGGWPGGTYISYRLTDGPAAGLVVYAAEDIQPAVSIGQSVTPNTVIGQMYEGYTGIETGWSDARGDGTTMASDYGQYYGGNSTAFGANFSALLASLGGPGGQMEGGPSGSLPGNWPSW